MRRSGDGFPLPPSFPVGRGGRWNRWGWVFAAIWLVYLSYPAAEILRYPSLWPRVGALAALVVFAVTFVVTFMRARARRHAGRGHLVAEPLAGLVLMAVLLAVVSPIAGEQVIGATIYIAVVAVMELPDRIGWAIVAVTTVTVEVLSRTVPGWDPAGERFATICPRRSARRPPAPVPRRSAWPSSTAGCR